MLCERVVLNTCMVASFHQERSLTPPLITEVSVHYQESGCVRGIDFVYDSSIRFWNCSDSIVHCIVRFLSVKKASHFMHNVKTNVNLLFIAHVVICIVVVLWKCVDGHIRKKKYGNNSQHWTTIVNTIVRHLNWSDRSLINMVLISS